MGDVDSYLLPDAKGYQAMLRHLLGEDDEYRQKVRDQHLALMSGRAWLDWLDWLGGVEHTGQGIRQTWKILGQASTYKEVESLHERALPIYCNIVQALRVALLREPPNTFFEDTFMWSGEDAFPAAEFPPATELPNEDAFGRRFCRSRISPRHRITQRRRFSKTLFPAAEFPPATELPNEDTFKDAFPAAEFLTATELPCEDAFRWRSFLLKMNFCPARALTTGARIGTFSALLPCNFGL